MKIKAMSIALSLTILSSASVANPLTKAGVFILESDNEHTSPVVNQTDQGNHEERGNPLRRLKHRAVSWARSKAVYLNTHPVIGDPDLPREYHDILPHEVAAKLKESFLRKIRRGRH